MKNAETLITVTGYFGKEKQITKQDFVKRWKDHAKELFTLSGENQKTWEEINELVNRIEELACDEADRIIGRQARGTSND